MNWSQALVFPPDIAISVEAKAVFFGYLYIAVLIKRVLLYLDYKTILL